MKQSIEPKAKPESVAVPPVANEQASIADAVLNNPRNEQSTQYHPLLQDAWHGVLQSIPLVLAAVPFALVYGALGQSLQLSFALVMAMSILVFAGASQFIALTLLAAGAQVGIIVFTVFLVNLRHMLYSISLVPYLQRYQQHIQAQGGNIRAWQKLLMGFTLTDETFAVVVNRMQQHPNTNLVAFYIGSSVFMYCNWILFSALGFQVGVMFSGLQDLGLEVAMVVAFTGIVVSQLKQPSHYFCMLTAGAAAIVSYHWPHQLGLLFSSFVAIAAGLLTEAFNKSQAQEGETPREITAPDNGPNTSPNTSPNISQAKGSKA